jgi:UPF0042 nucleotide-binding protein
MVMASEVANELTVITGLSGAGRSTAAKALEDLGWYVVDNLPSKMLLPLAQLVATPEHGMRRLAVVIDTRAGQLFTDVGAQLEMLESMNIRARVVFLEADDAALVRRFEQVRRPHPLQEGGTVLDGIHRERALLASLRERANIIVDTAHLNPHQLRTRIFEIFDERAASLVHFTLTSFGFKYGIPLDADMVSDLRFLPNPFWVPELRHSTGLDANVRDYVLAQPGAAAFLDQEFALLTTVVEGYRRENKHDVMVAFGCTGGKHRSVAMMMAMAARMRRLQDVTVNTVNRDLGRE